MHKSHIIYLLNFLNSATVHVVLLNFFQGASVLKTILILLRDRHISKPFNLSLDIWLLACFTDNIAKLH